MSEPEVTSEVSLSSDDAWHVVEVDESVFPIEVVLKATYWMTGHCDVEIRRDTDRPVIMVSMRLLERGQHPDAGQELQRRLRRDLIDFRTRAIVERETRTIRDLLVAKAFDDSADAN